jgi:hypothetical protein
MVVSILSALASSSRRPNCAPFQEGGHIGRIAAGRREHRVVPCHARVLLSARVPLLTAITTDVSIPADCIIRGGVITRYDD